MDKSFNDQELSDIMKEIEALEEDFSEATPQEDVLAELVEMKESEAIPMRPKMKEYTPETKAPTSSMSFKVQGDMNVELQFEVGGKTIALSVSESGLNIQMEGGMTFNVPLQETGSLKKVA